MTDDGGSRGVEFIVNPRAGSHRRGALLAACSAVLAPARVPYAVRMTRAAGHAEALAREAARNGASVVAAVGGDGTVHEVANGLAGGGTALAVLPWGSGNGLAGELGLSRDPLRLCGSLLARRLVPLDLGVVAGRRFVNVAGVGYEARVAAAVPVAMPRARKLLAYAAAAVGEFRRHRPAVVRVTVEGTVWEGRPLFVCAANGRRYGAGMQIAPPARVDDGSLDLVWVEGVGSVGAARIAVRMFLGSLAKDPAWRSRRFREARIESDEPLPVQADGEAVGTTPCTIRIEPSALRLVAPLD